jgi:outer membrane protein assembly factor BamB
LIWKKKLFANNAIATSGGLTVKNGKIYVGTNERVYVIDAKSSEILAESKYLDSSALSTMVSPLPFEGKILWGKHWRGLVCFDEKSGETLWQNKDVIDFLAEPIIVNDVIYVPTRYRISKLDKSGNIICESEKESENFFNTPSTPLYYKGRLFVPTTERGMGIYNADTLDLITYIGTSPSLIAAATYNPIGEQTVFGKPIIDDGILIFAAADGNVYFCDAESYEVKRTVSIGHPILSGIIKTDFGYCVTDFDGGVSFIK